jgi:hypothetical protein
MARRLGKGDVQAFKVLADRAYGRLKERAEVYWSESIVEWLQAGRRRVLERMSPAEIVERIEQLQTELGRRFGEESEAVLLIGDLPMPEEFRGTADAAQEQETLHP